MLQWSSPPVTALGPSWAAWVSAGYHRACACGLASCRAPAGLGCAAEAVHRARRLVCSLGQVRGVIEHIEKRMKELQAEKQELAEFQELDKVRNCLLTLWPIRSAFLRTIDVAPTSFTSSGVESAVHRQLPLCR